jgi:xylulose-5-phosphate/fructose-6-phosphate phosphoketolase
MPDFQEYAVPVPQPGSVQAEFTHESWEPFEDVKLNWEFRNFRVFGPDETASNRLTHLFDIH